MRDLIVSFLEFLGKVPDWVLFGVTLVLLPVALIGSRKDKKK